MHLCGDARATVLACHSAEHEDEVPGTAGHGPPPNGRAAGTGLGRRPRGSLSRHSGARLPRILRRAVSKHPSAPGVANFEKKALGWLWVSNQPA